MTRSTGILLQIIPIFDKKSAQLRQNLARKKPKEVKSKIERVRLQSTQLPHCQGGCWLKVEYKTDKSLSQIGNTTRGATVRGSTPLQVVIRLGKSWCGAHCDAVNAPN